MKQLEKMKKPEDSCMQAETRDEKELLDNLEYHNNFSQIMLEQMECGVLAYTLPGRKLILQRKQCRRRLNGCRLQKQAEWQYTKIRWM